jgi:hypothetical protein
MRVDPDFTSDDTMIQGLISAAREHGERITGKCLARRMMRQVLDSFPYYTDTIQSQLAYPPSYYSLPRYSTTLWNYSEMIKLWYPPVISVQRIRFIDSDGNADTLEQDTDFILDRISYPARIFPVPGNYWPPAYYTPNGVEIDFTAGYGPPVATGAAAPAGVDTYNASVAAWSSTIEYGVGAIVSYESSNWQAQQAVPAGTAPAEGAYWQLYTGSPVSGQQPDSVMVTACPHTIVRTILMLTSYWYENRNSPAPPEIDAAFAQDSVIDFQPTRG